MLNTVQQLRNSLGVSSPPISPVRIVDQDGNKYVAMTCTYHPAEGDTPAWAAVNVEPETPES